MIHRHGVHISALTCCAVHPSAPPAPPASPRPAGKFDWVLLRGCKVVTKVGSGCRCCQHWVPGWLARGHCGGGRGGRGLGIGGGLGLRGAREGTWPGWGSLDGNTTSGLVVDELHYAARASCPALLVCMHAAAALWAALPPMQPKSQLNQRVYRCCPVGCCCCVGRPSATTTTRPLITSG